MLDSGVKATVSRDNMNRVAKILVDSGEASYEGALDRLRGYRIGVQIDAEAFESAAGQTCLLTLANVGYRSCVGGVFVAGLPNDVPLLTPLGSGRNLGEALAFVGGEAVDQLPSNTPQVILGKSMPSSATGPALRAIYCNWSGGVVPLGMHQEPQSDAFGPAAMLAGAIAAAECFQLHRGSPRAGRRTAGISLWEPGADWQKSSGPTGPLALPSKLWLLGLGHLGQAYAWALASLPYRDPSGVDLVLHDYDKAQESNLSTSILTQRSNLGKRKTRIVADWLEERKFSTRIIERAFGEDLQIKHEDPRLMLCGVDNARARQILEKPGFSLVLEAGLGADASGYLDFRTHAFTNHGKAAALFPSEEREIQATSPAYDDLRRRGVDECGIVRMAGAAVGAPFVGATAAALIVSQAVRAVNGMKHFDAVSGSLRALSHVESYLRDESLSENIGTVYTE